MDVQGDVVVDVADVVGIGLGGGACLEWKPRRVAA